MTATADASDASDASYASAASAGPSAARIAGDRTLRAHAVSIGYDGRRVIEGLDLVVPEGQVTVIVGPNACGKSTLLRGLAGLHPLEAGRVTVGDVDAASMGRRRFAKLVGVLPQTSVAPDGVRVAELVARGRFPHQGWFGRHSSDDDTVVAEALAATGVADLADRRLEELSGGQRQRVWIAMVLAQQTDIVLLDEPTTFLDLTHQLELLLDLLRELNRGRGTTVVMVLHELNLAARYADRIVVMRDGRVVAEGTPAKVITGETVASAFGLEARIVSDPVVGTPLVVPVGPIGAA